MQGRRCKLCWNHSLAQQVAEKAGIAVPTHLVSEKEGLVMPWMAAERGLHEEVKGGHCRLGKRKACIYPLLPLQIEL